MDRPSYHARAAEGHKSPEVLALNPRGQLPTFKDGSVVVNESLAAIIYLEEAYDSGTQLLPKNVKARAQVRRHCNQAHKIKSAVHGKRPTHPPARPPT